MVVAAGLAVPAFVDVDGCCILEVLRELHFSHMGWKRMERLSSRAGSAALYTSTGMSSDPGVFPADICLMTFESAFFFQQFLVIICIEDMKDCPSDIHNLHS